MLPNNIFNAMSQFGSFMQNPQAVLMNRFNLPANMNLNNPNEVLQHLLNSGNINQRQLNEANQLAQQVRNNPMFQNMFR